MMGDPKGWTSVQVAASNLPENKVTRVGRCIGISISSSEVMHKSQKPFGQQDWRLTLNEARRVQQRMTKPG
jgi:hypothetical protein